MFTSVIEKILDVVCEQLSKKWYGYDTNTILRDNFIDDIMSYEYIINKKYLEYLFIHINIETDNNDNLIDEYFFDNIFDEHLASILQDYKDENLYHVEVKKEKDIFHVYVYESSNTIEKITCDYSYLCNFQYDDIFE